MSSEAKRSCSVSVVVRVRPLRRELREVEPAWTVSDRGFVE
eukprot:gene1162-2023_t